VVAHGTAAKRVAADLPAVMHTLTGANAPIEPTDPTRKLPVNPTPKTL
jgi:hypothetical protein